MEKATNIPDLFEVECPPEKIQISLGKYQTFKLKYLVNKVTAVKITETAFAGEDPDGVEEVDVHRKNAPFADRYSVVREKRKRTAYS